MAATTKKTNPHGKEWLIYHIATINATAPACRCQAKVSVRRRLKYERSGPAFLFLFYSVCSCFLPLRGWGLRRLGLLTKLEVGPPTFPVGGGDPHSPLRVCYFQVKLLLATSGSLFLAAWDERRRFCMQNIPCLILANEIMKSNATTSGCSG